MQCSRHVGNTKITYASGEGNYKCYLKPGGGAADSRGDNMECEDCATAMKNNGVCEGVNNYFATRQGNLAHIIQATIPDECTAGYIANYCGGRQKMVEDVCEMAETQVGKIGRPQWDKEYKSG